MATPRPNHEFLLLQRLQKVKQSGAAETPKIGPEMVGFFKSLEKRQQRFGKIGECWMAMVPEALADHTCLDSLVRGTLTVLVDTSAHMFELKQLMLSGLEKKLVAACKGSGLRKVVLKPGTWEQDAGRTGRD